MAVATSAKAGGTLEAIASFGGKQSTKTVLRFIILALIAGAAIASRLFSVIREFPRSPITQLECQEPVLGATQQDVFMTLALLTHLPS